MIPVPASSNTHNSQNGAERIAAVPGAGGHQRFRLVRLLVCLLFAAFCVWQAFPRGSRPLADLTSPAEAAVFDPNAESRGVNTLPIQEIRVGQRVLAHNPQITDAQRQKWGPEPDYRDWLHVSARLPKQTGGELQVELLRPTEWVTRQTGFLVTGPVDADVDRETAASARLDREVEMASYTRFPPADAPLSPYGEICEELAAADAAFAFAGTPLLGLTIELDLPEMGATGTAVIDAIHPAPAIDIGPGRVVTATFRHPPSSPVLDVTFAAEDAAPTSAARSISPALTPDTAIGVTANHPFWSVDRQEFIPIGDMQIGERVRTFQGDTKRIISRLPRPGPTEQVHNLEVDGEHVYFVGDGKLLAHNSCLKARAAAYKAWKARRGIEGRPTPQQFADFTSRNTVARKTGLQHYVTTHGYSRLEARANRALRRPLTQAQESAVRKIGNIERGHLKAHDFTGTLRDMAGNPVPKPSGGYWDHLQEMNNSLRGLRKHAKTLASANDPAGVAARQRALELIKQIEDSTRGAGI